MHMACVWVRIPRHELTLGVTMFSWTLEQAGWVKVRVVGARVGQC